MEKVNVEMRIPKDILFAAGIREKNAESEFKKELAIQLFREKHLSFGKACELSDMNKWDFLELLGSRKIPLNYDVDSFKDDLKTIKGMNK